MLIREQREGAAWRCGSLPLYISVTFARQPGGRRESPEDTYEKEGMAFRRNIK